MEQSIKYIFVDEVGRGPAAYDVVVAGISVDLKHSQLLLWDESLATLNVKDSKKLTQIKREQILKDFGIHSMESLFFNKIYTSPLDEFSVDFVLTHRTHEQIDNSNILACTLEAMDDAIFLLLKNSNTKEDRCFVYIDGNRPPKKCQNLLKYQCVIKGDSLIKGISLASIIAKEYRDFLMDKQDVHYPMYGFKRHKGYLTKEHQIAIKKFGLCPIHRKSFNLSLYTPNG